MKAESYITSRKGGIECGYQLMSDEGDIIMDMVLGDGLCDDKEKIENVLEEHRQLVMMMAAAPAIVSALERMIQDTPTNLSPAYKANWLLNSLRNVIAIAKGEQQ